MRQGTTLVDFPLAAIHELYDDVSLNRQVLRNTGLKTSPAAFVYVLTSEGWAEVADLIEPFCEAEDFDEHYQWLNEDGKVSLLLSPQVAGRRGNECNGDFSKGVIV